jgi:hypothetical protein
MGDPQPERARVSLEEMTRRRDQWRTKAEAGAKYAERLHHLYTLARSENRRLQYTLDKASRELRDADKARVAAEAQATEFAQELGRLRDELRRKTDG